MKKKLLFLKNNPQEILHREKVNERLRFAAAHDVNTVLKYLGTTGKGLPSGMVEQARERYGDNVVTHGQKESLFTRICKAFINPFTAILFVLAAVSAFTDIWLADPGEEDAVTVIIITTMVMISGILRFVQETRSGNAAAKLSAMIETTTCVERMETGQQEIPLDEVVVGDLVHLSAGDMVPADIRIIFARDLFVSQSALTGESEPVEKYLCLDVQAAGTPCRP